MYLPTGCVDRTGRFGRTAVDAVMGRTVREAGPYIHGL